MKAENNNLMSIIKKSAVLIYKYTWQSIFLALLLVMTCPFICLGINEVFGFSLGELRTCGLPLSEFLTVWLTFWAIIGAGLNVWLMLRELNQQNEQIRIMGQEQANQREQIRIMGLEQENQQKQIRDTQFATGVELLGNVNESARIDGVYHLYNLVHEYPKEYLEIACEILCAHVRTITSDKKYQEDYQERPSNEIQTILKLLFREDRFDRPIFDICIKNLSVLSNIKA